ncbi:uncharacterized protein zgc:153345 [Xyrauchen texanus]|uniref:uncharacterized protein zgc:153345 n=1 Tax=Xyrauchen texanus TaxID=154827 RepID=UPI002242581F|nr:uncharacterized protein zgc:153345 [Xyrauchen texanus]
MSGLIEERLRVVAIIHALKTVGIRVKNWKNFLNADSNSELTFSQESVFAFGRNLHLLPQHQQSDMGGTVPQFLVEACEYLSQHLNTEGLFRKTGSLSRIRALRADLEQGKPVFNPSYAAHLQPCDVASLIKQFLRELPSPLIPADLQNPLIQAQGLEMSHDQEGARNRTTLLITALFPSSNACTLRYLCTFLRQAAERCSENRMNVSSLAVVIAPNLLQCPTQPSKLTMDTEKHLDQQAAVIKSFILHADHIGVVPSCVLEASKATETTETPSPTGGTLFSKRTGLSVYRSLKRQRRRSVGEIFVDAFSKLKPCRTPTGPPIAFDVMLDPQLSKSPTPQSPIAFKRKATEETVPELEGSAKKRRSLHDLREDTKSSISQPTEGEHSSMEEKNIKEDLIPTTSKKRNQMSEHRKSLRPPAQEEKVHRRKRSLRFFTVSSGSNSSNALMTSANKDSENCLVDFSIKSNCKSGSPLAHADACLKIPLILIDGPGRVVVGNEVEDDPDLLNCSFAESPNNCLYMGSEASRIQRQNSEPCEDECWEDECWTILEDENFEQLGKCEVIKPVTQNESEEVNRNTGENEPELKKVEEQSCKVSKEIKKSSKNRSRPRRSISLPEVTLELCRDEVPELGKEVGRGEPEMDNNVWPMFTSFSHEQESESVTMEKQMVGSKEMEGQEMKGNIKILKNYKQDKMADSTLSFKRPHQRLSMAERLRGFTALTLLLRTSRAAPQFREKPQEGLQRGTTRLQRQGARRFGRSISHEGVSERSPEQSPERSPPANQAFIGICGTSPDSGVESVDQEPINNLHHQEVYKIHRSQNSPKAQPTNDENFEFSPMSSDRNQHPMYEMDGLCKQSDQLNKSTWDVEEDLDKLLAQKCHIDDQTQDQLNSSAFHHSVGHQVITPDLKSPTFFQQMVPLNPFEDFKVSLQNNDMETSLLDASPPFEFPVFASLGLDGVITEDDTINRLPCDLSPPAFHFRRPTTRRRYRDSPRWPSHEVRMSAWNPLPL